MLMNSEYSVIVVPYGKREYIEGIYYSFSEALDRANALFKRPDIFRVMVVEEKSGVVLLEKEKISLLEPYDFYRNV